MMAFQVNAKALIFNGSSVYSHRGPDAAGYPSSMSFGMKSGGGPNNVSQNNRIRKIPVFQPLSSE